jgi:hypothetical protein
MALMRSGSDGLVAVVAPTGACNAILGVADITWITMSIRLSLISSSTCADITAPLHGW